MSESVTLSHPTDNRLTFEAIYHPAEKQTGEWMYSLGTPPTPAWYEITAVAWNDGTNVVDITDFLNDYADHLLPKWEKQLAD
jgi:hypothetical protein